MPHGPTRRALIACASVSIVAGQTGCAERAPAVTLPEPVPVLEWAGGVDTLAGTYSIVASVAEFWDSVLVVPDVRERILWRVDMTNGTREQLGTQGGGPGEYARVASAAKVHRDSVAILQGFSWMPSPVISVATGRGRTVSWRPDRVMDLGQEAMLMVSQPLLRYGDTLGNVYGEAMTHQAELDSATGRAVRRSGGPRDTLALVRFSLRSDAVDSLLMFPVGVHRAGSSVAPDGATLRTMGLGPYGPYNTWTTSDDGRLWLVDAARYQVRVLDPRLGEAAAWSFTSDSIPVSQEGWDAYVQRTTNGAIEMMEKSVQDISARIGAPMKRPAGPRYLVPAKPVALPPVSTSDGRRRIRAFDNIAWIPVSRVDPPGTEFWDIVDIASGERLTTVVLPANHRLLHLTKRGAYLVAKDDDDLERILLYRAPATRE